MANQHDWLDWIPLGTLLLALIIYVIKEWRSKRKRIEAAQALADTKRNEDDLIKARLTKLETDIPSMLAEIKRDMPKQRKCDEHFSSLNYLKEKVEKLENTRPELVTNITNLNVRTQRLEDNYLNIDRTQNEIKGELRKLADMLVKHFIKDKD